MKQMKCLAEMIANCWDADYKRYTEVSVYDGRNTHEISKVVSTFGFALKSQAWLPARSMEGFCYKDRESGAPIPLLKGSDLYKLSEQNKEVLHNHMPYIGADLQSYDFVKFLQVKETVSQSSLLGYLVSWSEASHFESSIDHMRSVYIELSKNSSEETKEAFSCKNLIFVPSTIQRNHHVDTSGRFVSIHSACWKDETTILFQRAYKNEEIPSHLPKILSAYYNSEDRHLKSTIKYAFGELGVEKELKIQVLIDLLDFNASLSPTPTKPLRDDFRNIAEVVVGTVTNEEIGNPEQLKSHFYNNIKNKEVFPSVSGKWVSLNGLYIDDDNEVSRHFAGSGEVHFLKWPTSEDMKRQHHNNLPNQFTELCCVSQLSKCAIGRTDPGSSLKPYHAEFQRFLHQILPLMQCYIAAKITDDQEFHEAKCKYVQRLAVFSVFELTCVYCIDKKYYAPAISIYSCRLHDDDDPPSIYIVVREDNKISDKMSLVDVLIKAFVPTDKANRKVRAFFQDLILEDPRSDQDKDTIRRKYTLKPLPENLPIWHKDLPAHLQREESSESETEEEEEEDYEDKELPHEEPMSVDEPSEGLRSWPPRAPLGIDIKKTGRHGPGKAPPQPRDSKDIITISDVQQSQQLVAQVPPVMQGGSDSVSESEKDIPREFTRQLSSGSGIDSVVSMEQRRQSGSLDGVYGRQTPLDGERVGKPLAGTKHRHGSHDQQPIAGELESVREAKEPRVERESTDEESHFQDSVTTAPQQAQVSKIHRPKLRRNYTNLETVDVSYFMQPLDIPDDFKTTTTCSAEEKEHLMEVGKWGERFVCQWLQHKAQLPNGETIVKVEWLNEGEESGEPCDIKVSTENGEFFIEVKSTKSSEKALVPISWNELCFAKEKKEFYILFRVYNVPRVSDVRLMWLQDLFERVENPKVTLYVSL